MKKSDWGQEIYSFLLSTYKRYLKTPERSLEEAYKAALQIKTIEENYFNGSKIASESTQYSRSIVELFESDLKKHLKTVRMRLTEFKGSRIFLSEFAQNALKKQGIKNLESDFILQRLRFIDEVVGKYNTVDRDTSHEDLLKQSKLVKFESAIAKQNVEDPTLLEPEKPKIASKADATGVLPRSILSTIGRLQVELNPNSEQEVVKDFRRSQKRTLISVRFLLLLVIIPLLTHQLSKTIIVGPIVDSFRPVEKTQVFINYEMEEKALAELGAYREKIIFENFIKEEAILSPEEVNGIVKEKAREIAHEYQIQSASALKNVFADLFSVAAFIIFLAFSKPSIAVLKDFFDHVVYGLSDSAKAFIIILFTDIFVGFHSPHGWEVVLEGISRHWGLPASHDFIYLFIATFPVILDTIFKYWIFRYLNRISPSAVATYHNMNE